MGVLSLDFALTLFSKHDRKSTKLLLSYDTSSMTPNNSNSSSGSGDAKVSPKNISQGSKIAAKNFCKLHASRSSPREAHRLGTGINSQQSARQSTSISLYDDKPTLADKLVRDPGEICRVFSPDVPEENKIIGEGRQIVFNHHPEYIIRFIIPKTAENKHGILFSSIALGLPGYIYVGPFSMWSIVVKLPSKMSKGCPG
jgi:hypothetical protein